MNKYLFMSLSLFVLGNLGLIINRKSAINVLMSLELILLAANTNFIAFSNFWNNLNGQVMVFFVLTVAATEAAIGLALVVLIYRQRRAIDVDDLNKLQG